MIRSREHGHAALVQADRDTRPERDDLGRRPLGDELDSVEADAVEDVVTAELAGDDLRLACGIALELEQLGADEHARGPVGRGAVRGERAEGRLDEAADDPAREDVPGTDELGGPARDGEK